MSPQARVSARLCRLLVLTAAFVIPLAFQLQGNEAFETPKSAALKVLALAVAAAATWRGRALRTRLLPAVALYLGACLLSTVRTPLGAASAERLWELASLAVLAVAADAGLAPRNAVLGTVFFSWFCVTVYGGLQYLGVDWINWTSFGDNRVYSTMGNPDFLGQQSSFLVPVLFCLLAGTASSHARILLAACLLFAVPSVLYTGSRGGYIAFVAACGATAWLVHRFVYRMKALHFAAWGAAVAALSATLFLALPTGRNFIARWMEFKDPVRSSSVQTRLFYWYSGWLMGTDYHAAVRAHPLALAGAGIGTFHLAGAQTQGQAQLIWNRKWPRAAEIVSPHLELYAHNDYVHLFAEIGPLGLGVFLWIMVTLLAIGWSALTHLPPEAGFRRWRLMGLEAATVSYYVNSATNFPLKVIANSHVFFACIAPVLARESALPSLVLPMPRSAAATALAAVLAVVLGARATVMVGASEYLKLGHLNTQGGRQDVAVAYFDRAARLNPIHTDAILVHYYLGKALQNAGDLPGAIRAFDRAIGTFPSFPEGHQGRGIAESQLAAQAPIGSTSYLAGVRAAAADLERALFLNPKDPVTNFFLGRAHRMAGGAAASVSPYLDAITYSGDKIPDAWWELAQTYADLKRHGDAVTALATLKARFPGSWSPAAETLLVRERAGAQKRAAQRSVNRR